MKHSIRTRLTAIFSILIVASFLICLIINSLCLERFYLVQKQKSLEKNYVKLEKYISENRNITDIRSEFESILHSSGISVILMNSSGKALVSSATNDTALRNLFFEAILNQDRNKDNVIVSNEKYFIQRMKDSTDSTDYLVLLGVTDSGKEFLMLRVTINSIRESVNLANTFLTYVILIALVGGIIVIFFVTKRITNPILELAIISKNMTELDFDTKYESRGKDEIDTLGENMNQLSSKLESTILELKVANEKLTSDIEKRIEIDEMRKEFLSNVSHELKTPIALIQGYAEGLKDGVAIDSESMAMYCDVILDESQKMNHMVRELITLNQLESDAELNYETFNLTDLIKGKIFAFEMKAKEMEVNLSYEGTDILPVYSDAFKVEQVLQNYLSNAFNHVSGERIIKVCAEIEEKYTKVSVFNTGDKIPEEELDKIWIKLYKVDKARTRAYGGSGIGLSIVKAIMESLKCSYGVENCDNGVLFWFYIENGR